MHIFPDIKLKFLKLIEYNNRNIFAEKSYTKCGGETITRSISIKSKFSMSLDQNVFIESQVEGYRNILKLSCKPLAFTSYEAFLKNKKRSGTSLFETFSA